MTALDNSRGGFLSGIAIVIAVISAFFLRPERPPSPSTRPAASSPADKAKTSGREPAARSFADVRPVIELMAEALGAGTHIAATSSDKALLARVVENAASRKIHVRFLIATIPDYVDSNSGWMADQAIGAIQSAMSRSDFLLDRFRLIDWKRADAHDDAPPANDSRLHDRQPGALIFRRVHPTTTLPLEYCVVLLVLETPTGGIHDTSLKNAAQLMLAWQRRAGRKPSVAPLRIVGPFFSGSTLSLALTLRHLQDRAAFSPIAVVSGAANGDRNEAVMARFAGPRVTYDTTVRSSGAIMQAMADTLARMNPAWTGGHDVALLVESNTAYGLQAHVRESAADSQEAPSPNPFPFAQEFRFPLHIAQLRSDATPFKSPVSLLPQSVVPLMLREITPPTDQIPPFRPQLTSSIVEAQVNGILDTLRHERKSAVGIVATDNRDVLFLAREIRRAMPGVQLFFLGSHLLYLHPDYVPYVRGALVASPYLLGVAEQRRELFPSASAHGIYNATLMQLGAKDAKGLLDCDPNTPTSLSCTPPVWVSVVGDHGFWPLATTMTPRTPGDPAPIEGRPSPHHLQPIPTPTGIVASLILLACAMHVGIVMVIGLTKSDHNRRRFTRTPLIRVMMPPQTHPRMRVLHTISLLFSLAMVLTISAFTAVVLLLYAMAAVGVETSVSLRVVLMVAMLASIVGIMIATVWLRRRAPMAASPGAKIVAERPWPGVVLMGTVMALVMAAICAFLTFTGATLLQTPATLALHVQRILAGGIVSPAGASVCLFAALYVTSISGMRRLSYLGGGYTALGHRSPAFRLFVGAPGAPGAPLDMQVIPETPDMTAKAREAVGWRNDKSEDARHLAAMLDMPLQNLPWRWTLAILAAVVLVWLSAGSIATVDGRWFTWFLVVASYSSVACGLLLLAQAAYTWALFRPTLQTLAGSPLGPSLGRLSSRIHWNLSLVPPRSCELRPLLRLVDALRRQFRTMARRERLRQRYMRSERRTQRGVAELSRWCESGLAVRRTELTGIALRLQEAERLDEDLTREIAIERHVPLLQSPVWLSVWKLSDLLVSLLEHRHWARLDAHGRQRANRHAARWFASCEQLIALQYALLIRDVLARIMWSLFTAMLSLTLVAAAHLFYIFQGRSSLLTVDLMAIAVAALISVRVLVEIERDHVVSKIRHTNPGRIDFSWQFAGRLAVYGILPILAVIGSLFPEIGESVFQWLEPLRQLSTL